MPLFLFLIVINSKKYKPTRPLSRKGKFLVGFIRLLYYVRLIFGRKNYTDALEGHHEDPSKMNLKQQIYFGYKYYFRVLTHTKNNLLKKYFSAQKFTFQSNPNSNQITLSTGGDLMPYADITPSNCKHLWDDVGPFFFDADLVFANLETPIDIKKPASFVPEVMLKNMYFNGSEELFTIFSGNNQYKGYDVLSVANNHSLDQGEEGLLSTLQFLKSKNIASCGASESREKIHDFPILEKNGIKVAFLSYTYSLNALKCTPGKEYLVNHSNLNESDPEIHLLIEQTKIARERGADFIVAALHMGCAYQPYPSEQIIENFKLISEKSGIDLLLGSHPHNAMPLAQHAIVDPFSGKKKKSFFVFSQGDFVAYDIFKWCKLPLLLKFTIEKNGDDTYLADIKAKLVYTYATIKNNKVNSLQFLDYKSLKNNHEIFIHDRFGQKEFLEVKEFAENYLLPGNLERFI